jgi:hypothetical protein
MDYDLWLRMFSVAREIHFHPVPLSYIYLHAAQKTQPENLRQIRIENFMSVMGNLPFLELDAWTFFWKKWIYRTRTRAGVRRFLPRLNDLGILAYAYRPKLALKLAGRT